MADQAHTQTAGPRRPPFGGPEADRPKYYTFGYAGHMPGDLTPFLSETGAFVADVRLVPNSTMPAWQGPALKARWADRYVHVRELGNQAYKEPGAEFAIVDLEAGIARLLRAPGPVVIMCGCGALATCHRRIIAEALQALGHEVPEILAQETGEPLHPPARILAPAARQLSMFD